VIGEGCPLDLERLLECHDLFARRLPNRAVPVDIHRERLVFLLQRLLELLPRSLAPKAPPELPELRGSQ
jgi:hypothetical protein